MIQDKTLSYWDDALFSAASTVVDVQSPGAGKGQPVMVHFAGNALVAAAAVTVVLESSETAGGTYRPECTLHFADADAANAGSRLCLTDNCQQFTRLTITGVTAGNMNGSIVWDIQTNV